MDLESDDIDYLKKKMEEKETRILPTVEDKWVSLHESFGLLCWCDDEELRKEFKNLNNVNFLFLGTEETQMLQDKVSVLLHKLGIPSLSGVVTREAIYSDPTYSRYKTSLVNWALPFAQRYIYNIHPNKYSEFKLSGIQNLEVVEAGNLSYKNVIERFGIKSSQQHQCGCILDNNVLYATCNSDSHPLFMELSRLLLAGIPQLHLANFLHVITTMAQSGFTDEKMEEFITNRQKLLKLPDQEPLWSILSASASLNYKQSGKIWPPVHWKTPTKEEIPALSTPLVIMEKDEALNEPCNISSVGFKDEAEKIVYGVARYDGPNSGPQLAKTGRIGEEVAYKYFSEKLGEKCVKWVNEDKESHLPYDIVVEGEDNSKEYIEVKATTNARKNWFEVSVNEWQCALEKGDSFSIARVVLSDGKLDQVVTYKDPVKLCQSGHLDLQLKPVK